MGLFWLKRVCDNILYFVDDIFLPTKEYSTFCWSLFLVLISRPEYAIFLPLFIFLWINSNLNSLNRVIFFMATLVALPLILLFLLNYALSNFTTYSLEGFELRAMEDILDARFYRQFRADGGETAFYDPSNYEEMRLFEKLFLNVKIQSFYLSLVILEIR